MTSSSSFSTYPRIIDFGQGMNQQASSPLNPANPLTYCLFPTLNSQFIHGSSSSGLLYDTNNASCTNFMAERCALEWDGFCDAYQQINVDNYWPNTAAVDKMAFDLAQYFLNNRPSVGESLVRNACFRRFLGFHSSPAIQPFDPTVASSPMISLYSDTLSSATHLKNLENPSNDPWIQKMLENPKVCMDVLARIYLGMKRQEKATSRLFGTALHDFFTKNHTLFDRFLEIAVPRLQSFQERAPVHWNGFCGTPHV